MTEGSGSNPIHPDIIDKYRTIFWSLRDERRPYPDYMKGSVLEAGIEIVRVGNGFSKLRSMVAGDAG